MDESTANALEYIKKEQVNGKSDDEIKTALKTAGWQDIDIIPLFIPQVVSSTLPQPIMPEPSPQVEPASATPLTEPLIVTQTVDGPVVQPAPPIIPIEPIPQVQPINSTPLTQPTIVTQTTTQTISGPLPETFPQVAPIVTPPALSQGGSFIMPEESKPVKTASSAPKIVPVLIIILLIIVLGAVGIFFIKNREAAKVPANSNSDTANVVTTTPGAKTNNKVNRAYSELTLSIFSKEDLQRMGAITLPVGFTVQEEYRGIKLVRSPQKSYTPEQLNLLKHFLDLTPKKLLTPGPAAVVIAAANEIEGNDFGQLTTVAYASGPYMFFNEDSFSGGTLGGLVGDDSLDFAYYAFEHELMHNAQFNENANLIAAKLDVTAVNEGVPWTEAVLSSPLVEDFAKIAGWEKSASGSAISWSLVDPTNQKTTEYGKTDILEDMAETVAGTITTKDYEYSGSRIAWADNFLGESADNLKKGKFPFSTLFTQVKSNFPTYDFNKKDEYKAKYTIVDEQIFATEQKNSLVSIKDYLDKELADRGWSGKFTKEVKSNNIEIYKGDFVGNNRNMYIEVRTYDNATGFSEKPIGTQIVVLSGYDLR